MCHKITIRAVTAAEYNGKLFRTEGEAAQAALQDIAADLAKNPAQNMAKNIEAWSEGLRYVLETLFESEAPAKTAEKDPPPAGDTKAARIRAWLKDKGFTDLKTFELEATYEQKEAFSQYMESLPDDGK